MINYIQNIISSLGWYEQTARDLLNFHSLFDYKLNVKMDLFYASRRGNLHRVQELLAVGVNANDKSEALVQAATMGQGQIVEFLLSIGAETNAKNEAFIYAASNDRSQVVEILLTAGADINTKNGEALKMATIRGHIQMIELLLYAGADVNAGDGETLHWAIARNYIQIAEILLAAGADIKILPEDYQIQFKHLIPIQISIQEYLMLELFIINILELKDRFVVDVVPEKKYIVLK